MLVVVAAQGCSLLVSTTDLTGGDAGTPHAESGAPLADATLDGPVRDANVDADAGRRDPSIIGEWTFEDTRDGSGKGHDIQLVGDAVFAADGLRGKCVTLSGDGRIKVPSLSTTGFPPQGTLSAHLKYTSAEDDITDRTLIDGWDDTRAHLFIRRPPEAAPREFQAALQPTGSTYAWVADFTLARNAWAHIVLVWKSGDGNTGEGGLYVDKKLVKRSGLDRAFTPTAQEFELGVRLIGSIDDVVLYDRALTEAEALALD